MADEFPVVVELRFKSQDAKDQFLGGLSDGWGEDACDLTWEGDMDTAKEFFVFPFCQECRGTGYADEIPENGDCPICEGSGEVP